MTTLTDHGLGHFNPKEPRIPKGKHGAGQWAHLPGVPGVSEVAKVSPERFTAAFDNAFRGSPYSAFVNHYTPAQIRAEKMTPILAEGGKTGVLVHDHGDGRIEATALFNNSGKPGAGLAMMRGVIRNYKVNYAECFGPALPKLYETMGFRDDQVFPFDPGEAPSNWDYKRFDNPSYHTMNLVTGQTSRAAVQDTDIGIDLEGIRAAARAADPAWWDKYGEEAWNAAMVAAGIEPPAGPAQRAYKEGLHPRNPHTGEWIHLGGGFGDFKPLANDPMSMLHIPAGDPRWGKMDNLLKFPKRYSRDVLKHQKGDLKRPALPDYHESAQKTSAAIVHDIRTQGTLAAGKKWYPAEHRIAEQRAKAYNIPLDRAVGVVAATSPRCGYQTNQRVSNEILDSAPRVANPAVLSSFGGGVMRKFRDDAVNIAIGNSIDQHLGGVKRRAFYNNIMFPGQTNDVTVDTWMQNALMHGLGLTREQSDALATERTTDFPAGIGRILMADATRLAARELGIAPDEAQSAFWIAAQKQAGVPLPGRPVGGHRQLSRAFPGVTDPEDLDATEYDSELLIEYLSWLVASVPGRVDLGPPDSARLDGSKAADNLAAWAIVQTDPRFKTLGISLSTAQQLVTRNTRANWNPSEHPRDPNGRFVHIVGSLAKDWDEDWVHVPTDKWIPKLTPAKGVKWLTARGRVNGTGTADDPIDVKGNIDKAIRLLAEGKHVRLNQVDEISILLDKVKKISEQTKDDPKKPTWDFGLLTVKGTNLFTAQHRGIPRIEMPQFSGPAQPNSKAAKLAGGTGKFVDLTPQLMAQLKRDGITVAKRRVPVAHLRATQTEINGGKVAGFADAAINGNKGALSALAEPIFVTRDHYVIDGHHRWAANMMLDALDGKLGNDTYQNVLEINMDIGAAIPYANQFAIEMGIAARPVRFYVPGYSSRVGTMAHEPIIGSKGKGLWGHKGMQLPAYIQHVANDLIESGHSETQAIEMAIGIIKNWAHGHDGAGNKVSAETAAKATIALAEWEKLRAEAKARMAPNSFVSNNAGPSEAQRRAISAQNQL